MRTGLETREELFAVMEQIAEEREAARPIVRELVARGRSIDDIEIPEGWRTAGMVLELIEYAYNQLETEPLKCLSVALLALAIATATEARNYGVPLPTYLAGRSLREIGNAHRFLNDYSAANRAMQSAEAIFEESALFDEHATTLYLRASILFLSMNNHEALSLADVARGMFIETGDLRRQIHCEMVHAFVDWRVGNFESARTRYEAALRSLSSFDEPYTIASICQALGRIYRYLGRTSDAVTMLERAREIFTALEMPSEVSRVSWGVAQILLDGGDAHKALMLLKPAREDFLSRHMPEEAGEVGLHMIDAFVAVGQLEIAKRLATEVLREFVNANLNVHAISALGYLRDLLETKGDARAAVRHVRSFVERLKDEPALLFLPLDEKR
jgi:tetratricopeptide (TPR) repeat protein